MINPTSIKMIQLYNYCKFSEKIDTQYGEIDYVGYLHRERKRILASNPDRVVIIKDHPRTPGMIGLFVDDIATKMPKHSRFTADMATTDGRRRVAV